MKRFMMLMLIACCAYATPIGWPGYLDYSVGYYYYDDWAPEQAYQQACYVAAANCNPDCTWQITYFEYYEDCKYFFQVQYTRSVTDAFGRRYIYLPVTHGYSIQYLVKMDKTWRGWMTLKTTM